MAGLASFITVVSPASLARALSRPCGLRVSSTDEASARYSRWRLTASWTSWVKIGARIAQDDRDHEDDQLDRPAPAAVVVVRAPAAAEPERVAQEEARQQGDAADEDADEQREPDVEVADVRELVAEDALELLAIHHV